MSNSINKVILVGHIGRDPEVRSTSDGTKVVTLTLATSERWKDRNSGEQRERTEWHRVVVFNEALAKVAESYIRKGSHVYIEGALQTRKWTDQSGQERYSTEVVLQKYRGEITLLGSKSDNQSDQSSGYGGGASGGGYGASAAVDDSDPIPF